MNTHEQYEELCALAASGQASPDELTDLRSHLEGCPSCRNAAYDFTQVSAQGLAQVAAKRLRCEIPIGMTQRFVARARSEGIEMRRENAPRVTRPRRLGVFAALAAVAVIALIAGFLFSARQKTSPIAASPHSLVAPPTPSLTSDLLPQGRTPQDEKLRQELNSARSEISSRDATIQRQQSDVEGMKNVEASMASRLAEAEQESARSSSEKTQLETRITALEGELSKSKSDKSTNDAVLTLQENELRDLRNKLADQQAALGQQEEQPSHHRRARSGWERQESACLRKNFLHRREVTDLLRLRSR